MEIFNLTLSQMLMMFTLMLIGFVLRKTSALPDNAHITISKLETFVFVPALTFFNQVTQCTVKTFIESAPLILYGFCIIVIAVALSYPLSYLYVRKWRDSPELEYKRNVYKYAMTFGNYGFMGNFIILGVFGNEMFYKYGLFTFAVAMFCNSWGLYILIPKDRGASLSQNLKKGILTPPMIALFLGIALGLLGVGEYMPDFLVSACSSAGNCMGPLAMLLAGFVVGGYDWRELFADKKVYIATAVRLIAIPAVMMLLLKLMGTGEAIRTLALIAFATPLGLNTIVYPAAYGGDPKTGASMAMISHTLSVVTIPLMYLIFIVLL